MSEQVKRDVNAFSDRMIELITELHNALEDDDKDRARTALEAMIGLVEILRSTVDDFNDNGDER